MTVPASKGREEKDIDVRVLIEDPARADVFHRDKTRHMIAPLPVPAPAA
ncbi:hypothetical protein [Streptantibioticus ferralitis]|uniref:Uncharacterized protein n=1 Tax=Streptantibioticus ferralitis TaxID=236510 RepID=A0ABT5ZAE5_9ACTN|nr:hypothetical protein [Streptantibioticus ferralitis]MDF2260521.1 hypothetical protein [Streptantibioticus ferralitis]